jgi:hypothetical protein
MKKSLYLFGMPVFDMTEVNFLHNSLLHIFSFGRPPVSIDIMTQDKGLSLGKPLKNQKLLKLKVCLFV